MFHRVIFLFESKGIEVLNHTTSFYYMPIPGWFSFINHRLYLKKDIILENARYNHIHTIHCREEVVYHVMRVDDESEKSDFIITENGLSFI